MSGIQNDWYPKWPVYKMTGIQNDWYTKWLVYKISSIQNDRLIKWPVYTMTSRQNACIRIRSISIFLKHRQCFIDICLHPPFRKKKFDTKESRKKWEEKNHGNLNEGKAQYNWSPNYNKLFCKKIKNTVSVWKALLVTFEILFQESLYNDMFDTDNLLSKLTCFNLDKKCWLTGLSKTVCTRIISLFCRWLHFVFAHLDEKWPVWRRCSAHLSFEDEPALNYGLTGWSGRLERKPVKKVGARCPRAEGAWWPPRWHCQSLFTRPFSHGVFALRFCVAFLHCAFALRFCIAFSGCVFAVKSVPCILKTHKTPAKSS